MVLELDTWYPSAWIHGYWVSDHAQIPVARKEPRRTLRMARRVQMSANPSPGVLMQRTREELADLLRESQENLKKSRSTHRKLKTVITKVNKVIGRRRSVKRKPPK